MVNPDDSQQLDVINAESDVNEVISGIQAPADDAEEESSILLYGFYDDPDAAEGDPSLMMLQIAATDGDSHIETYVYVCKDIGTGLAAGMEVRYVADGPVRWSTGWTERRLMRSSLKPSLKLSHHCRIMR